MAITATGLMNTHRSLNRNRIKLPIKKWVTNARGLLVTGELRKPIRRKVTTAFGRETWTYAAVSPARRQGNDNFCDGVCQHRA